MRASRADDPPRPGVILQNHGRGLFGRDAGSGLFVLISLFPRRPHPARVCEKRPHRPRLGRKERFAEPPRRPALRGNRRFMIVAGLCLPAWRAAESSGQIFDRASQKAAIHMVSAWTTENGVALAQTAVDAKSNEITAFPKLLDMLVLEGGCGNN